MNKYDIAKLLIIVVSLTALFSITKISSPADVVPLTESNIRDNKTPILRPGEFKKMAEELGSYAGYYDMNVGFLLANTREITITTRSQGQVIEIGWKLATEILNRDELAVVFLSVLTPDRDLRQALIHNGYKPCRAAKILDYLARVDYTRSMYWSNLSEEVCR